MTSNDETNRAREAGADNAEDEAPLGDDALSESLLSLDSTLPPTPLKQLLAADGASVYVLSLGNELAETVQEAGGEQYPIHVVDGWSELEQRVEQGRARIVLLDVDALPDGVEACLDRLLELGSRLVVLVAAEREAAQPLIGLLSARRVHRLLIKPASAGVTRLLLESAVNRYLQIRDDDELDMPVESLTRRLPHGRRSRKGAVAAVSLVVVALGLGAAIVLGPGGPSEWRTLGGWLAPPAGEAGSGTPARVAAERDAADASSADASASAGEASSSEASSAEASSAAGETAADPAGTLERLYGRAERALVDGDLEAAASALERIRAQRPEAARLTILESQLTAARERAAGETADGGDDSGADAAADEGAATAAGDAAAGDGAGAPAADSAADPATGASEDGASADGEPQSAASGASEQDPEQREGETGADEAGPSQSADGAPASIVEATESLASGAAPADTVPSDAADAADAAEDAGDGPAQTAASAEYARLFETARERIEAGRLVAPEGDSARTYFERAADANGADPRLIALREQLAEAVAAEARVRIDAGDVAAAEALVDYAFELGLDAEVQAQLDVGLTAARRAEWLELARERIDAGRLTAPEGDSARAYLSRLENDEPGHDGLADGWAALRDALAERVRRAVEAGDWARAESALAVLEDAGAEAGRVTALREQFRYARRQAEYLSEPAPAAEMTLVERGSAAYPEAARDEDVEGWAEVEFVVDEDGVPGQARVVASEPEGYFEQAALESVRASRYAPFEVDGRVYERLVRVRVRFGLR